MADLDYPIMFLDIEGLERRWKCGLSMIETLAETDEIQFCLRPAALEIALAKIPREKYHSIFRKLATRHIDHKYVYLMFKDKEHKIEIAHIGNIDMKEILESPLHVDFFDLIIPMNQIQEFEFRHSVNKPMEYEFTILADDFTCISLCGHQYKFGEVQAKIIKRLWQAREDGNPWMYGKRILTDIGAASCRIQSVFNHHPYWRRIIESDRNGKYRLKLPPKQMSLFG